MVGIAVEDVVEVVVDVVVEVVEVLVLSVVVVGVVNAFTQKIKILFTYPEIDNKWRPFSSVFSPEYSACPPLRHLKIDNQVIHELWLNSKFDN